ncbi:hypothetical protein [Paenibacillus radicis (ex Xue et al. 2023)]|uniref:Choloylglycine hydrolase/NAAA C-terminal domain-containing protein n=1 Tax=Paenibacillus radicis (ex Xue et al. 2023) TaxID=2972489 RepID=A0ABT1YBV8_9BACL|nr:hypothetical protein [Paenibacillus radicis (ex Xue et al. 2023)]MCR8630387.1 hypothetical protein [Paenibacillus radicis (ex Xue et al. 2023)]
MCTTGAVVIKDRSGGKRIFGFKTSDSPLTGFWHGQVNNPGRYDALGYGLTQQQGINAGMNEKGLMVISSYFGYKEHMPDVASEQKQSSKNSYWSGDVRGIVQAEVLAGCSAAAEAAALFVERFSEGMAPLGGNHVIVDRTGELLVFEHCQGLYGLQNATKQHFIVRSNQAFTLFQSEQNQLPEEIREDRGIRQRLAEQILSNIKREEMNLDAVEVINRLKQMTALHAGSGESTGSICAHGVSKGRSNSPEPHETLSAMIWDIRSKKMHFTVGHPCKGEWHEMDFSGRNNRCNF